MSNSSTSDIESRSASGSASKSTSNSIPSNIIREKVVIIGGGPAGLSAAIYAARAGLRPVIAFGGSNDGNTPGGQLMITTEVENYPGFQDGITGPDLVDNMMKQAQRFGTKLVHGFAHSFEEMKSGGPFRLKIGDNLYEAETIICANGASARWLGLSDEDKYRNNGISACATCDGPLPYYRKKHLVVVGGGDSAMEEALFLTKFASKVTIIHRRNALRASKIMQKRAMDNEKIEIMFDTVIEKYEGNDNLERLKVRNVETNESTYLEVGGLFMAIGHIPNTDKLVGSGIKLDDEGYIKVLDNIHTNIRGVFACGDVHDTIYRQAITAAGFGAMAGIAAERWLENKDHWPKSNHRRRRRHRRRHKLKGKRKKKVGECTQKKSK